jgi:hypothetical protein
MVTAMRLSLLASFIALAGCVSTRAISPTGMTAYEVSLATNGDHLALAWYGSGGLAHNAIWLRFLDGRLRPSGPVRPLTGGQREAYEPDLQADGALLVLAWYEKDVSTGALSAWLGSVDEHGIVRWRRRLSANGHDGRNPIVRIAGRELLVAWIDAERGEAPAIWMAQFDAEGMLLGAAQRVAAASADTWNLNGAVDAMGTFYVVYDAALDSRANELQLLRIADGRFDQWRLTADDGLASTYPDIAVDGSRVAIAWTDRRDASSGDAVWLYAGELSAWPPQSDLQAVRITRTSGNASGAYLAWNGDRLALAWNEDQGSRIAVRVQLFSPQGQPQGEATLLSGAAARALVPSIRRWRKGFVVAWNEFASGTGDAGVAVVKPWLPAARGAH